MAGDESLTAGTTRRGLMMDSSKVFKEIFKIDNVKRVNLQWVLPGEDQDGNDTDLQAMTILLDREIAEKVNWENGGIYEKIPNFAERYFVHPSWK
ncbi:hypothetical protein [Kroppenstedtia eburnea]|uniref:hypothetical protein n=1 Tax=Kroppenstedtia eburnea TaxID=714067 RepID=UPI001356629D|nr:hypothetical protein [Kroppenstedtia eburnea]QKI81587.1 hypothetical protein GXN75_06010 [Kroppenstedtia eburnea]